MFSHNYFSPVVDVLWLTKHIIVSYSKQFHKLFTVSANLSLICKLSFLALFYIFSDPLDRLISFLLCGLSCHFVFFYILYCLAAITSPLSTFIPLGILFSPFISPHHPDAFFLSLSTYILLLPREKN